MKILCEVWEITNPEKPWKETFNVSCKEDVQKIFNTFNASRRPNEDERAYYVIKIIEEI